jgi:hypothetical protein
MSFREARLSFARPARKLRDEFDNRRIQIGVSDARVEIASRHGEPGTRREALPFRRAMVPAQDDVRSKDTRGLAPKRRQLLQRKRA